MDDKALTEMLRLQMKEDEDNQQSQSYVGHKSVGKMSV
jgi:hypothetical protein